MQAPSDYSIPCELLKVREMTTAMVVAAQKCRWMEVQRIDNARAKLLGTLPSEFFASHDDAVRSVLQEALSATRAIEIQARDRRDGHAGELKNLNNRQNAAKAYGSYA